MNDKTTLPVKFEWNEKLWDEFEKKVYQYCNNQTPLKVIQELMVDFKQSKQPDTKEKERVEVVIIELLKDYSFGSSQYGITISSKINSKQFPEIKNLLERYLNDEMVTPENLLSKIAEHELIYGKKYTKSELEEAESKAWEAARRPAGDKKCTCGYWLTLNEYRKSLNTINKEEKTKEQGWEIEELYHKICKSETTKDKLIIYHAFTLKDDDRWEIKSVLRKSDGVVFSVGDFVYDGWEGEDSVFKGDILGFECEDGFNMLVKYNRGQGNTTFHLNNIKKSTKPSQPEEQDVLFTTEDGVEIREGDSYYRVNTKEPYNTWIPIYTDDKVVPLPHQKSFKKRVAAEQYILEKKPCLSLNDLLDAWYSWDERKELNLAKSYDFYRNDTRYNNPLFKKFVEKAKQKLSQ